MRQTAPIVLAALLTFGITASLVLRFMPEPVEDSDYLIAGSVATLAALVVMFLATVSTRLKSSDVFVKKRPKQR
jgi:hypothetical protein